MAPHSHDQTDPGDGAVSLWHRTDELLDSLADAEGVLLLLDFDGTLAEIEEHPDEAAILPESAARLTRLDAHPDTTVAVVTGRSYADIDARIPIEGCRIAGNHGFEIVVDGSKRVHPAVEEVQPTIDAICTELSDLLSGIDGALVENKSATATVHYRLADAESSNLVRNHVREVVGRHDEKNQLRVTSGKQILEIRPAVEWDKGRAVDWLKAECIPDAADWVTIYIGDDVTDEAAFRALATDDVTIKVGPGETDADYRVDGPAGVTRVLDFLLESGLGGIEATERAG